MSFEIGPLDGIGVIGGGTAFPALELGNEEVLRGLGLDEERARFLGQAALAVAAGSGPALVVGAETFSKIVPPQSRTAALALGDGAAALIVGRRGGARLLSAVFQTDGALGKLITTDGALPPTEGEIARGGYLLSGAPDELLQI